MLTRKSKFAFTKLVLVQNNKKSTREIRIQQFSSLQRPRRSFFCRFFFLMAYFNSGISGNFEQAAVPHVKVSTACTLTKTTTSSVRGGNDRVWRHLPRSRYFPPSHGKFGPAGEGASAGSQPCTFTS